MRSIAEWIGKTDDELPPPRVRLRIYDKFWGRCHICAAWITPGSYWQCDHIIALCNGGANRESNLGPACRNCCYSKTAADVAEKSKIADKRKKHILPKASHMPGSRQSKWKRKMNGEVVRRG